MSIEIMTAAWKVSGLSHTEKLVLLSLSDNANDDGVCWPRIKKMMERCDLSESSVHRSITSLEGSGHIERIMRPGRSTVYKIHPLQSDTPSEKHPTPITETPTPPQADTDPPSQRHPESSPNPQEPSRNRQAAKRGSRTVPADWTPLPGLVQAIQCDPKCAGVDIERELAKMRNFTFKSPHKDWPKTFYNWCLTAGGGKTPAKVDGAGKPVVHKFYVTDEASGNLDLIKVAESELKPWELEKLRALQKKFKSKTIFYLSEIRNNG